MNKQHDALRAPGTGIGRLSGEAERLERATILDKWDERCRRGVPGTHTLGPDYKTARGSD